MSHVLVVDDEPDVRLMLRLALQVEGHDVDEVGTGAEALRVMDQIAYDGVVLDVHLPDMSGWDVLERIRKSPSRADTMVVIVTADVSKRAVDVVPSREGPLPERMRMIYKPLDPRDLVTTLEDALRSDG